VPTEEKVRRVAELAERIEASAALLLTEYRGLTVSEISELRRSLGEAATSFSVVKNTIMQRAASAAGMDDLAPLLVGPSAVAFVDGDPVAAAKALTGVAKRYPALVLKGGWMDGRALTAEEARRLADLESREVMLSKIAGVLQGEIARAASMLQAAQSRFLSLLEAYRAKLPSDQAPPTEEE
jgi:large subunit ribosomal protein L10